MNGKLLPVLVLLLWSGAALAQGYAGLGNAAPGFAVPDRQTVLEFPADDAAHPEFRVEWWYLTANLQDAQGNQFGVQWTLFRNGLSPGNPKGWENRQVWMAHAALTSRNDHFFEERFSRGGTGAAGVSIEPFDAWLDGWQLTQSAGQANAFDLTVQANDFGYHLQLGDDGNRVLHGQSGYSVKSREGAASHYYSRPNFDVTGQIEFLDEKVEVTGTAWLDREWSSQPLSQSQEGWDWFGIGLDDGRRLMLARVRDETGDFLFGSLIDANGRVIGLNKDDVTLIAREKRHAPTRWMIEIPSYGLALNIVALNRDAWTGDRFSYWEGPIVIDGSHTGVGYLEMTGYRR